MDAPQYVTQHECEERRKAFDCKCEALSKRIGKEHDRNIEQDGQIKAVTDAINKISRIGWLIFSAVSGALIASILDLILK